MKENILKTIIVILITVETVDLLLYKHSIIFSISLAFLAAAFTVVAAEAL
jgi:hypothetical protein